MQLSSFIIITLIGLVSADYGTAPSEKSEAGEIALLTNLLAQLFTPNCLRVFMISNKPNGPRNVLASLWPNQHTLNTDLSPGSLLSKKISGDEKILQKSKYHSQIIVDQYNIHQSGKVLTYVNNNPSQVTPFSCVIYLLAGLPDSRLLPVLTDPFSRKKLTRYFLVHAQNATNAEQFLLDQRLVKEENVAAFTHQESQNKTYWRVLIRQLLHHSGSPQVLRVNKWSTDTGLANTNDVFPDQMTNLYGEKMTAVTLYFKPFTVYDEVEGSLTVKPKPCVDVYLLDVLSKKLNFTYVLTMPADGQWGVLKDDGHFTGIVGDVEFRRANFSLNLGLMLERARVVDFSKMYFMEPMGFITAKSSTNEPWRKLLTPFRLSVWLSVVVSVAVGALLYHLICEIQGSLAAVHPLPSQAFMSVLGSILAQSLTHFPWLSSGRVFLGFWLLYALLVTTYYKTYLTSSLTVPFAPSTINTLQQLHDSNLEYGIINSKGATYQLFMTSTVPQYQKMVKDMQFHTVSDSLVLVNRGRFAFITAKTLLHFTMLEHNSNPRRTHDLHVATEEFFPGGYSWAFPKGATYLRSFERVMWRCVQVGLVNKWYNDLIAYYIRESKHKDAAEEKYQGQEEALDSDIRHVVFSLNHLQGPFFVLLLGCGGGVLLLLLEMYAGRARRPN